MGMHCLVIEYVLENTPVLWLCDYQEVWAQTPMATNSHTIKQYDHFVWNVCVHMCLQVEDKLVIGYLACLYFCLSFVSEAGSFTGLGPTKKYNRASH